MTSPAASLSLPFSPSARALLGDMRREAATWLARRTHHQKQSPSPLNEALLAAAKERHRIASDLLAQFDAQQADQLPQLLAASVAANGA